jgi:hypothetical protein
MNTAEGVETRGKVIKTKESPQKLNIEFDTLVRSHAAQTSDSDVISLRFLVKSVARRMRGI